MVIIVTVFVVAVVFVVVVLGVERKNSYLFLSFYFFYSKTAVEVAALVDAGSALGIELSLQP